MPEYVNVPVHEDMVDDVMKFITDRIYGRPTKVPKTPARFLPGGLTVTEESREWTREQLEILANGSAKSIKLFCEVLDILVAGPEEGMTIAEVAERTGVPGLSMQHSFGRATIWIRNRIDDKRWPIYWPGEDRWAMSENNRTLWKSVRG